MSPSGPLYPSTVADTGTNDLGASATAWVNPNNAKVSDGVYTTNTWASAGLTSNGLKTTGYGFNVPAVATIDGIYVEFQRQGTNAQTSSIDLVKAGSIVSATSKPGTDGWPSSEDWIGYGGATDLWGVSWTPSDINDSGFGAVIYALNTHGGGEGDIDAVRITVYWHIGALDANKNLPKRYLYKVYRGGQFLGCLPNVTSDFATSQDINTAGVQITVSCAVSADVAAQPNTTILDESGNAITDEAGNPTTDEGALPAVDVGTSSALIRNGNHVVVWEYSYYHPQGIVKLQGTIENWKAKYGGDSGNDSVTMIIYSDGSDMDEHIARPGNYSFTNDQSQTAQNASDTIFLGAKGDVQNFDGQTFQVGGGVTNLGSITLLLKGTANVTVNVYDSPTSLKLLGTVRQGVSVSSATAIRFTLPRRITVTPGASYFFTVQVDANQSIKLYYDTANPYANGTMYNNTGTGWGISSGNDLYFVTASSNGLTTGSYTNADPTTGMAEPMMDDYIAEGGLIGYNTADIQATGLSLTYQVNANTVNEALQGMLKLAPDGFYYYVDIGLNTLVFKQASQTADLVLIKGRHLNDIEIVATIEYLVNTAFVIGGLVSGANIYTVDQDPTSIALYGQRIGRHTDSNILDTTAAHVVGASDVAEQKDEQYQTVVSVLDKTMDISTIKLGMVVGFSGFGNFPDSLLAMIVHIDYKPEVAVLTLGILPKRQQTQVEQLTRKLLTTNSVGNPTTPS